MPRYHKNHFTYFLAKIPKMLTRKSHRAIVNDIIDAIFHPLFGQYMGIPEVVDFIFHSIWEGEINLEKFFKYNFDSFMYGLLQFIIDYLRSVGFYATRPRKANYKVYRKRVYGPRRTRRKKY